MRYQFCHTLVDEQLGTELVPDLDCELEVELEFESGDPVLNVTGVFIEDRNLFRGSKLAQSIARQIAIEAQDCDFLISRVMADQQYMYVGRGGNDPDGRIVRYE